MKRAFLICMVVFCGLFSSVCLANAGTTTNNAIIVTNDPSSTQLDQYNTILDKSESAARVKTWKWYLTLRKKNETAKEKKAFWIYLKTNWKIHYQNNLNTYLRKYGMYVNEKGTVLNSINMKKIVGLKKVDLRYRPVSQ